MEIACLDRRSILGRWAGAAIATVFAGCESASLLPRSPDNQRDWSTRRKGFNVGTLDPSYHLRGYLQLVKLANANLVRVFITFHWDESPRRYVLPKVVEAGLVNLMASAQELGMQLVVVGDFEVAPNPRLWQSPARAAAFVDAWSGLARRLGSASSIAAYDLINEPNPPWSDGTVASAHREWWQLADTAMLAIRAEDSTVPIVFEPIGGGQAIGFEGLVPFAHKHIVYSLHFYTPHGITHQGVSDEWPHVIPYPAESRDIPRASDAYPGPWNAQTLRASLAPARRFQLQHQATMFVGEFSCVRWAPNGSAERYVRDCLACFKEFDWSWCYHEFRGWPGWDAELVGLERMGGTRRADAPVMRLLQQDLSLH